MDDPVKLRKIVKRGAYYRLYISGLENPLLVNEETVHQNRLTDNIVLTPSQLTALQEQSETLLCDLKASRVLTMRDHSVGELRLKLKKGKFGDKTIKSTIAKYRKLGYLDDARYARMIAQSSLNKNPSGRAYLVSYLQKKHIDRSLAERTVDSLLEGTDEVDLAVRTLERKWGSLGQLELETARRKAYNYLSRRGIGYAAAKSAFERLYKEIHEEES